MKALIDVGQSTQKIFLHQCIRGAERRVAASEERWLRRVVVVAVLLTIPLPLLPKIPCRQPQKGACR